MPRTIKKATPKKKPKKKSGKAGPKAMEVESASAPSPAVPSVWRPGVDPIAEDEQLDYDPTAYDCYHGLSLEWPCLSFDICKDDLGAPRSTFPHTMFMVTGSQAGTAKQNTITVVKLANLGQGKHGKKAEGEESDESDSSDDDEDEDNDDEEPPRLHFRSIEHRGGINRIRCMPQRPGLVAVWGDSAQVKMYDVDKQLKELAEEQEPKRGPATRVQLKPLASHSHSTEGFAMDWSPQKPGLFASGDCRSRIHVWTPQEGGRWQVGGAFQGHEGSVEEIQWSPTEETVFVSAGVDGTIRVWDTRERSKAMITVKAHDTDVNVATWNRLVTYMLASGDDDGVLRIWDLRSIADGSHVSQFRYHSKAITSVEWSPYESSMLTTSSADNTIAVWDLALERDPEEEAALVPEGAALAPQDLPAQLLFVHAGQADPKEVHWHPQVPGLVASTAADGFNVFKPSNL